MTKTETLARKPSTAIIRDIGFLVAVIGFVIAVIGLFAKSAEWFQFGIAVGAVGAFIGVIALILRAAGLKR